MFKYKFINSGKTLTENDIQALEREIGQSLPEVLKDFYLQSNGGELEGERYVYLNEETGGEFNVNTFLPIKYKRFEEDYLLEECFNFFVKEKEFMPPEFIPFAIDDGGYPYAVNTRDLTVNICYLADIQENKKPMRFVAPSLQEFVNGMVTEEEAYQ
jgi:hypothetical protein